jgi:pyruvate/2-oxoglutarate dehydrogenase complex dihydrolipoamide dehydrogenase (E3) component
MSGQADYDIAVVGAGAGGLAVATGAALLGARTILIERGRMGGTRLNGGDMATAALVAAARQAVAWRGAEALGINYDEPDIDFPAVLRRVQAMVATSALNDSVERLSAFGATVLHGEARFTAADQISVGNTVICPRRIVIATGSRPAMPPIAGLADIPFLTTDTVFAAMTERPLHLMIIGGGPAGTELAQAFRRLGTRVTLVERLHCLNRWDPEIAGLLTAALRHDGVVLHEQTEVTVVENTVSGIVLTLRHADSSTSRIAGSHLLVATGRSANTETLDLAAAGIATDMRGIAVNTRLRSSNKRVWAIGDVTGRSSSTHGAQQHATVALKNILFRLPVSVSTAVPEAVYGDPEIAAVGLSESAARAIHGRITILRSPFALNDRAMVDGRGDGLVKLITTPAGRLLGAAIAGPQAADLIQPWVVAIRKGLSVGTMQAAVAPYPTRSEAGTRAATDFYRPKLLNPLMQAAVRFLARFG